MSLKDRYFYLMKELDSCKKDIFCLEQNLDNQECINEWHICMQYKNSLEERLNKLFVKQGLNNLKFNEYYCLNDFTLELFFTHDVLIFRINKKNFLFYLNNEGYIGGLLSYPNSIIDFIENNAKKYNEKQILYLGL